jgi:hypothetical protein
MSCTGGICAPTAKDAVLNAGDLETLLASGNVTVTTTGAGVEAQNIDLRVPLSWSSTAALSLAAHDSVTINRSIAISGSGGLSLSTGSGQNDSLSLGRAAHVTFANLASALTIDGVPYTLENNIKSLAGAIAANPGGAYALAGDYDATQDGVYSSVPIPTVFGGTFEGLGNSISHLSIDDSMDGNVGLFAQTGSENSTAALRDLRLRNVHVAGNVSQGVNVGGLVGLDGGAVINCYVSGKIMSDSTAQGVNVGGLVGANGGIGSITNSFSAANVTASRAAYGFAGGLVGASYGQILNSGASGSVSGITAGGLVGALTGYFYTENSFATGDVSGIAAGGFVGVGGLVDNSYATGNVSATTIGGGFLGAPQLSIFVESYSTGKVNVAVRKNAGGFAGGNGGMIGPTFFHDYWDTETSGLRKHGEGQVKDAPGLKGLTTAQLQSGLPAHFDPTVWAENPAINNGLPYLIANPPPK